MIRYIELSFGYVEEGSAARVLFYNNIQGFNTKEDALLSLALNLRELFEEPREEPWAVKKCCKAAIKDGRTTKFCPNCGHQLYYELSKEKFSEWLVREIFNGVADGYPRIEETDSGWWPWDGLGDILRRTDEFALTSDTLVSVECAENVLANLAYDGLDSDWQAYYQVD